MVTPVSLALVFNVVCLTKSVYTIYQVQKGSGQVTSSRSRVPLLLICFKRTAIMGLTWILTLVANWKQASFLQYPATVLNSLQGKWYACRFLEGWGFDFVEAKKKGNQSPFISFSHIDNLF